MLSPQPREDRLWLSETVPGIDRAILIELGSDLGAFRQASHLHAWAGVAQGNPMPKTTLAESALGAARSKCIQFHTYHKARRAVSRYKQAQANSMFGFDLQNGPLAELVSK